MTPFRRFVLASCSSGFIPLLFLSLVVAALQTGSFFGCKDGHLKVAATFLRRAVSSVATSGGSAA
jgi:hypothetical protein